MADLKGYEHLKGWGYERVLTWLRANGYSVRKPSWAGPKSEHRQVFRKGNKKSVGSLDKKTGPGAMRAVAGNGILNLARIQGALVGEASSGPDRGKWYVFTKYGYSRKPTKAAAIKYGRALD